MEEMVPIDVYKRQDLVVILTGHSCVDYELVVRSARVVLDTKNATCTVVDAMGKVRVL